MFQKILFSESEVRLCYFHCIIKEIPTKVYHHIRSLKQQFISNFRLTSKLHLLAVLHRAVFEFSGQTRQRSTFNSISSQMHYGIIETF